MTDYSEYELATRAVRTGQHRSDEGEHSEAIYPTSSFVFSSAAEAAARFSGDQPGNVHELDHVRDDSRRAHDVGESPEAPIGDLNHSDVWIDRAERIVLSRNGDRCERLKQGGLAYVWESDDADRYLGHISE